MEHDIIKTLPEQHMSNRVIWRDIVRIGENYYAESAAVRLYGDAEKFQGIFMGCDEDEILSMLEDADCDSIYDIDGFITAVAAKHGCGADDIALYTSENFGIPEEILATLPWGAESCGGYINGVNI